MDTISGFLGNSTIPLSTTVDVTESVQVRRRNGRPLSVAVEDANYDTNNQEINGILYPKQYGKHFSS